VPTISVILPVYNGALYVKAAIDSILSQSFIDFELIIINDGSSDGSEAIIRSINDTRIRFLQQENCGLAATLNIAISMARGEFIARQDQDDISSAVRLQRQVDFLRRNPYVGMVGSNAEIWVNDKKTDRLLIHPTDDASIHFALLFDNPFVHSSVMIRRSVFERVGGYCEDKSRQPPEDYELWSRVARDFKLANIPENLLAYCEVPGSMSRSGMNPFLHRLINISAENIACYTGRAADAPEVIAISRLAHGVYEGIPRNIRFSMIEEVLNAAAASISRQSDTPLSMLAHALKLRVAMLRYHYYQYRTGGVLKKLMGERLERYIKQLARRIISAVR
jgi:glycosyltransferase involved in cell wall biosynthesis